MASRRGLGDRARLLTGREPALARSKGCVHTRCGAGEDLAFALNVATKNISGVQPFIKWTPPKKGLFSALVSQLRRMTREFVRIASSSISEELCIPI